MKRQIERDSEFLLQDLIEECRQIVHDVVVPAARDAHNSDERRRYLDSAIALVRVGAAVGDAIARVRGGTAEQTHHRITVDRVVHALPAPGRGEGV